MMGKLTDTKVRALKKPGDYGDGGGLYLQVSPALTKSWLFRYSRSGKERWKGEGPYPDVGLAAARDAASANRQLLRQGTDPIDHRDAQRLARRLEEAKSVTFRQCADQYIAAHKAGWRNTKHAAQWGATLETYAYPVLGDLPVQAIDTDHVLSVIEKLWLEKPETAQRVRQRIEAVLDSATARKKRIGENPARWRGHLSKLLPKRSKVRAVVHHAALDYRDMPAFFEDLQKRTAVSARALAFTVLTAARSGEVRNASWSEIDLRQAVWTIPREHTKSGREHRVPLSTAAVSILRAVVPLRGDDVSLLFPGDAKADRSAYARHAGDDLTQERRPAPMSENTMRKYLQDDMGREGVTVHGFRSAFRDWGAETTSYPRELLEAALAHVLRDKTEAAYQRGDMFDRRRLLMEAWAQYCIGPHATQVVDLPRYAKT